MISLAPLWMLKYVLHYIYYNIVTGLKNNNDALFATVFLGRSILKFYVFYYQKIRVIKSLVCLPCIASNTVKI